MATTHISNYGSFGKYIPCDSQGFVKYNKRHFDLLMQGKFPVNCTLATAAVATATKALTEWRQQR
jgi:hypothetical protein